MDEELLAMAEIVAKELGYLSIWSPAREKREEMIEEAKDRLRTIEGTRASNSLVLAPDEDNWI